MADMDLGQPPHEGPVAVQPTSSQIASILKPWRTIEQRDLAVDPGTLGPVAWLRTCYKEGTDAQHEAVVDRVDMYNAVDDRLLNDATLYDFGDHWERIFDYIPELVVDQSEDASYRARRLRDAEDAFRMAQAIFSGSPATAAIGEEPMRLIESARRYLPAAEVQEHVLQVLQSSIHCACVKTYLIVEDEEALQTGQVLLLFLDNCGRAVRQQRLPAREAEDIGGAWVQHCWDEDHFWEDADLGADYQEGGVCGHLLYYKPGA